MTAMTTLTLIHHSEKWDRPKARVKRDAKTFREIADAVTHTEMDTPKRSDMLGAKDWSFCHSERNGEDETVAEWSNETLSLSGMPYSVPLTTTTYKRASGADAPVVHALVTVLASAKAPRKRVALVSVHMALDNTPRRAAVWQQSGRGLKALIRTLRRTDPGIKVIVVGDFNKDYRNERERAMIERYMCAPNGLRQAYDSKKPASGGTHGNTLIDGWLVDKGITVQRVWLLDDTDGSDHRPVAMRITF